MNCPYCGGTMIKGLFCDRGDSYFLPEGETPPQLWTKGILKKKRAVLLPPCCFANKLRKIFIQSAKKKRRLKGF